MPRESAGGSITSIASLRCSGCQTGDLGLLIQSSRLPQQGKAKSASSQHRHRHAFYLLGMGVKDGGLKGQVKDLITEWENRRYVEGQRRFYLIRAVGTGVAWLAKPLLAIWLAGAIVLMPLTFGVIWALDIDADEDTAYKIYFALGFILATLFAAISAAEAERDSKDLRRLVDSIQRQVRD